MSVRPWSRGSGAQLTRETLRLGSVAWLSSARVVRCLVKSYNERNPRFVLLRHAPKEKVFATEFWPTLAGDDDVELTAEKDSAFRRSARWWYVVGLVRPPKRLRKKEKGVLYSRRTASDILEEGGDDVKSAWPLWAGPHTCYNGNYNGKQGCKAERIRKDCLSSDCSLQLGNMKLESLVIADQHAAVNMYSGPVHTARHTLGIGFARSIGPMITHDFCVTLVPQRLLVGLLAHTTEGSLEKSFNCAIPLVSEPPAINRASFPPRISRSENSYANQFAKEAATPDPKSVEKRASLLMSYTHKTVRMVSSPKSSDRDRTSVLAQSSYPLRELRRSLMSLSLVAEFIFHP
ncbi:UNVERIFIED_CONTAM: hypothetical protein Scaly_3085400, partial [Sesamum calycinum]